MNCNKTFKNLVKSAEKLIKTTWNMVKSAGGLKPLPVNNFMNYFQISRFETFINDYKRFKRFYGLVCKIGSVFESSFIQIIKAENQIRIPQSSNSRFSFENHAKLHLI
jgi:hypothetical protein